MDHLAVLAAYPDDCRPGQIEPLEGAGGFSGARFWRVTTASGVWCLRCWPKEHPSEEGLGFIHAVLRYVVQGGFDRVPLPRLTRHGQSYVRHAEHLWELAPWLPGRADYLENPTPARLAAAMEALAGFHQAAATFAAVGQAASLVPIESRQVIRPDTGQARTLTLRMAKSPGIQERLATLRYYQGGGLAELAGSLSAPVAPEFLRRAERLLRLFPIAADGVQKLLEAVAEDVVPIQPCIRDIWHPHVLFEDDRVTGIVDFGSMRPESVAADIARLLGSMAGDDRRQWQQGIEAYQAIRPLGDQELKLIEAFDRSTTLMAGLSWIDWVCRQRRVFSDPAAVLARLDELLPRLEHLTARPDIDPAAGRR